jgi:hypothetical protein
MRSLLIRYRWLIAGISALLAVMVALALGAARTPNDADAPEARPQSGQPLEPYLEIGSWVDRWDAAAWRDPSAAVQNMADNGVRTIFIQTGSARSDAGITNPAALSEFITEAHARDMFVVAWYLPTLKAGSADYDRIVQAIEFTTPDGQRVDSFAVDIESTAVKSLSKRNRNLAVLSRRLRARVGPEYPLGGIIPSPVGLTKKTGFWNVFPYAEVADSYDVLLPMAYYTFDSDNAKEARSYALRSMRILRSQPGCAEIPVHLIGGIANKSSGAEIRAFAAAARETGSIGVSIYDWVGMSEGRWRALQAGWGTSSP